MGAIGGKTRKTAVLLGFCKIEHGGSSCSLLPCYGGLSYFGRAHGPFLISNDKVCHLLLISYRLKSTASQ